ncbi:hypothetical protein F4779DRAFT_499017 [Xylariaceae sp. FL0662B]|nr:hypothetical protein F4779DRAFT_499017 [Xylariaceae sp. FL0662B]
MHNSQWREYGRKREREDDDPDVQETMSGTLGFTEHRNKRLHCLPLRSSPTQKRLPGPPSFPVTISEMSPSTITPADSDSEDVQHQQVSNQSMDVDRDTEMMVDSSSQRLQPGPSQPDPAAPSIIGRMPTPIHCTFAAQVRGNNWGAANQSSNVTVPSDGVGYTQSQPFPGREESSVPRSLGGGAEWTMVQTRRLPSPISENGGEDVPTSPNMVLDSCPQPQRPYLPHMPHSTNPHTMAVHPNIQTIPQIVDGDDGMMDEDDTSPSSAPATPSPRGKFGHCRSKHTLNSWTIQPGMKKSFSIGYRADCEKCRMKIPGHFNHIIIS